ncbi:globin domain-containing protein [Streptomyces maoxianensis]|uniref:nitric oxide dioxygenase n=1 Tax=Streptomyces maoxianensis TaxID=1459942 RepID=A0ABV9GDD4_9ACTN
MDAPTTTSADNGTSGDDNGGGWFTPRKPASQGRSAPGEGASADDTDQERIAAPRRSVASIRPVGSGTSRPAPPPPAGDARESATPTGETPPSAAPVDGLSADHAPAGHHPGERAQDQRSQPQRAYEGHTAYESSVRREERGARENSEAAPRRPNARETAHPGEALHPPAAQHPGEGTRPREAPRPGEAARQRESAGRLHLAGQPPETVNPHGTGAGTATGPREAPWSHEAPAPHGTPADRPRHPQPAAPATNASPDAILIRRTMAEIEPVADKVTSYFYALLFVRHPELRDLFPAAMDSQRDRLLKALLTAADHMDNAAVLTDYLQNLGRGHRKYGTQPAHYPAVGEALIGSLTRYATATWDEETEAAWVRTYTKISQIMIDAAAENERQAPAWWHAEVVSHDLRTPDIAIITVRPNQPYAFLAGQYTSLETPWWPRIWRHYSFAGAPRTDGLLSFHVKAVPAGWVSNALVHHARPGDVLRLGPPTGSMTVDHTTDNGLLCLGGGTGIAPIKALVEDVAEHGDRRTVEVFYGARTDYDLYDIDTMLRLQQTHPWLSVRAVVDDRAQFPDAVREFGPWYEYDAYLSGPPGMIRSGVHALRGIGIPFDRIRHDSLEELVAAGD